MRAGVTKGGEGQPEERKKRRERQKRSLEENERKIERGEGRKRRAIVSGRFFRALTDEASRSSFENVM